MFWNRDFYEMDPIISQVSQETTLFQDLKFPY